MINSYLDKCMQMTSYKWHTVWLWFCFRQVWPTEMSVPWSSLILPSRPVHAIPWSFSVPHCMPSPVNQSSWCQEAFFTNFREFCLSAHHCSFKETLQHVLSFQQFTFPISSWMALHATETLKIYLLPRSSKNDCLTFPFPESNLFSSYVVQ